MSGKKKPRDSEPAGEGLKKISLIVPDDLFERVTRVCQQRQVNLSVLVRAVLNRHVDEYLEESDVGEGAGLLTSPTVPSGGVVVNLGPELEGILRAVACSLGLDIPSLLRGMADECLPVWVGRGKERQAARQELRRQMREIGLELHEEVSEDDR